MYKIIIFDLDGTLLDTVNSITYSLNILLSEIQLSAVLPQAVLPFIGKGTRNMLLSFCKGSSLSIDEIEKKYDRIYSKNLIEKVEIYPEITDLLSKLREQKVDLAVVTNKYHKQADILINHFFGNNINKVYGVENNQDKKPNPKITNQLLKQLKINPKEALFIGDSQIDYETAMNANVDFIFVEWGYGKVIPHPKSSFHSVKSASQIFEVNKKKL